MRRTGPGEPMQVETYCGGVAETNGYLALQGAEALVVDAPEGMAGWMEKHLSGRNVRIAGLLLTHGHWDHIVDACAIQRQWNVPVWIHRNSAPLLETPSIQSAFNPFYQLQPCKADRALESEGPYRLLNFKFTTLLCEGHCPGSLCFYFDVERKLFGGDVLFAGGVGRWDLPGGSRERLMRAIESKILTLPEETQVFPGHGLDTTVGAERRTNPYLTALKSAGSDD